MTTFDLFPAAGTDECVNKGGCKWRGQTALNGEVEQGWVEDRNLLAVHPDDWERFRGKWVRVRVGGKTIDAKVVDHCSDKDGPDCSRNRNWKGNGFLVDLERRTAARLGLWNVKQNATFELIKPQDVREEFLHGAKGPDEF